MVFFSKLKLFLQGKASKKVQGVYLSILISFCIIFFALAIQTYSNYSIVRESISSLGIPSENPKGHLIWRIGMMILGILFIPHLLYFYNIFHPIAHKTSIISVSFSLFASVNLVGVGFFPEDTIYPHYTCAIIAFFGFFTSFCCNLYILTKNIKDGKSWPKKWAIFLTYFQLIGIMFLFILALGVYVVYILTNRVIVDPNLPLIEWGVFISDLIYIIALFIMIPSETLQNENS